MKSIASQSLVSSGSQEPFGRVYAAQLAESLGSAKQGWSGSWTAGEEDEADPAPWLWSCLEWSIVEGSLSSAAAEGEGAGAGEGESLFCSPSAAAAAAGDARNDASAARASNATAALRADGDERDILRGSHLAGRESAQRLLRGRNLIAKRPSGAFFLLLANTCSCLSWVFFEAAPLPLPFFFFFF